MYYVWIVEMFDETLYKGTGKWQPTVGCALTKQGARAVQREWKQRLPSTKLRLRKYYSTMSEKD